MGNPTNQDIYDRIVLVKDLVTTVKEVSLTTSYFDKKLKDLNGKGGGAEQGQKTKEPGWKTTASDWSGTLGIQEVVKNTLTGNAPLLATAVVGLLGIRLISWENLLRKLLDARGFERREDKVLTYGRKREEVMPVRQGPVRPEDIRSMQDARRVATTLARSLHDLSRAMQETSQRAA